LFNGKELAFDAGKTSVNEYGLLNATSDLVINFFMAKSYTNKNKT
jgi:hypothetical protein